MLNSSNGGGEIALNVLLDRVSLKAGSGNPKVAIQNETLEILPLLHNPFTHGSSEVYLMSITLKVPRILSFG
jgi:hypothetical protein